jgi:hypothetical protein
MHFPKADQELDARASTNGGAPIASKNAHGHARPMTKKGRTEGLVLCSVFQHRLVCALYAGILHKREVQCVPIWGGTLLPLYCRYDELKSLQTRKGCSRGQGYTAGGELIPGSRQVQCTLALQTHQPHCPTPDRHCTDLNSFTGPEKSRAPHPGEARALCAAVELQLGVASGSGQHRQASPIAKFTIAQSHRRCIACNKVVQLSGSH